MQYFVEAFYDEMGFELRDGVAFGGEDELNFVLEADDMKQAYQQARQKAIDIFETEGKFVKVKVVEAKWVVKNICLVKPVIE